MRRMDTEGIFPPEEIKALGGHDSELEQGEEWPYWAYTR